MFLGSDASIMKIQDRNVYYNESTFQQSYHFEINFQLSAEHKEYRIVQVSESNKTEDWQQQHIWKIQKRQQQQILVSQIYNCEMFSTLSRALLGLTKYHSTAKVINLTASKSVPNKFKYFKKLFIPVSCSALCLYYINSKNKQTTSATDSQVQKFQTRRDNMKLQTITEEKRSIFLTIWSIFCHTLRFFQLLAIFSPVVFLYPLRFFDRTRGYWLDMFVKSVQRAGVVWIKAFQYMSHRRDIIGPEMADKFVHLRQSAPQHSFQETKKNFEKLYGKKINEVFEEFDEKPIASGSVGQVYRAKYKGNKVAVKVRHPGVQRHIQRDVNLMFFFSRFLSIFSKSFSLPVSQVSMKKTLMDQINFKNQKDNLLIFNQMFKGNKSIKFPLPFIENSNEAFLVETFVEGVPITYYQTNRHPLNAVTARLGATTFFEMLMKNNFIHADCHGGNILVDIQQKKNLTFFSQVWQYIKEKCMQLESYMIESTLKSSVLGKLYQQSKEQEECRRKTIKSSKQKVVVNLIDVGMVIRLEESDRLNFINFIKCVLHGDGEKCAEMIYNLSIFDGKKIIEGKFDSYMAELKSLFSSLKNTSLDDLQGVQLLVGMLNIIRENNMKLEGQFATLLTNMLVLEAVAKNLHEDINILKCAVPYFKYAQKIESDMFDFSDRELV